VTSLKNPVKHFLTKFKKDIYVTCSFYSLQLETVSQVLSHFILLFENGIFRYFIQDNVNNEAFCY